MKSNAVIELKTKKIAEVIRNELRELPSKDITAIESKDIVEMIRSAIGSSEVADIQVNKIDEIGGIVDIKNNNNTQKTCQPQSNRIIPASNWNNYHDWPPPGGMRHLIFNEKKNGFSKCVRRVGRRVLIDERAFFEWVDEQKAHESQFQ
ncbi:hypothetical protein N9H39_08045 [Gammaproteobacteria bacterium]|nr:hypothetical protein [Gammaproteobacteria bacterium]